LANQGFLLLLACSILCGYAFLAAMFAARLKHRPLFQAAKMAMLTSCFLSIVAAVVLWSALFARDFSIYYVFKNSSTDLPWIYTFTAFWCSLEGSHFLWTLFFHICAAWATVRYAKSNEHLMPYVIASLAIVLCWMYFLAFTHSDVFAITPRAVSEGRGMNTLLQNPYMAIHPPMLFIGYTTLAIPFAYAVAALMYGDITEGWLKTVRRWALVSWCFLTAAIILGGRWAYVELGWAGYWAWDPVENSSFLPWLFVTALLHGLLIQGALGHLKRTNLVMCIFAFFFTFFGTFITRSGLITSVHSFAESDIGPAYLAFLAVLLFLSSALFAWRNPSLLPADSGKVWGVSRESALVVTLMLLLSFAAIVLLGTVFPIVSELLTKQRISVQAPYFNFFAPYYGLILVIAIAFGQLLRYGQAKIDKTTLVKSLIYALPATVVLVVLGDIHKTQSYVYIGVQILGVYVLCFCGGCLIFDLVDSVKRVGLKLFWQKSRAVLGSHVAHLGVLIMIFGFMGNYRGLEKHVPLSTGQTVEVFGYELTLTAPMRQRNIQNFRSYEAQVNIQKDGKDIGLMMPSRNAYPTSNELTNEIAVHSSLWRDLYMVLKDFSFEKPDQIVVQFNVNPAVRFVWWATVIMVIGGLFSLSDPYRGDRSRDVIDASWS
jgi:cytochrome c-type biogenesis protein CcmF